MAGGVSDDGFRRNTNVLFISSVTPMEKGSDVGALRRALAEERVLRRAEVSALWAAVHRLEARSVAGADPLVSGAEGVGVPASLELLYREDWPPAVVRVPATLQQLLGEDVPAPSAPAAPTASRKRRHHPRRRQVREKCRRHWLAEQTEKAAASAQAAPSAEAGLVTQEDRMEE